MTLLEVGNSEGARRCDAKCYTAEGAECDCICGGTNHGVGLEQAMRNTYSMVEHMAGVQLPLIPPEAIGVRA